MTPRIAALTMARNDEFFLHHWISYYGAQLGKENLWVFLDGTDQTLSQPVPERVHLAVVDHLSGNRTAADRRRIAFLSTEAEKLFTLNHYDLVIGTDVDEFLLVDPELNQTLSEFLLSCKPSFSLSALGIDVGQHLHDEAPLNPSHGLLSQRRYALINDRYTKASVLARPVVWGSGFHRVRKHNFHIVDGLFLFHFGCVDFGMLRDRISKNERPDSGWEKHLERRARTIRIITNTEPKAWEQTTSRARRIQNVFRQPYAWNKPTMLRQRWVVEIPERYRNIV